MWLSIHSSFRSSKAIPYTNRIPHVSWEIFKCIKDIAFRSRFAWWQNTVTLQHLRSPWLCSPETARDTVFCDILKMSLLYVYLRDLIFPVVVFASLDLVTSPWQKIKWFHWKCMSCDCIWIYTPFTFKFRDGSWNVVIKSPEQNDRATVQTTFFGRPAHKVRKMCSRMLFKIFFLQDKNFWKIAANFAV